MNLATLARLSHRELVRLHRAGTPPELDALAGREYRGWNRPAHLGALGIRKFVKGFFRPAEPTAAGAALEGFNIPVIQNGFDGEWLAAGNDDAPARFGFYTVGPAPSSGPGARHPNAVFLDYAASERNVWREPARVLRDFLVEVEPGRDDLLLGQARLALAPGVWVFSNFFLLEYRRPHAFRG